MLPFYHFYGCSRLRWPQTFTGYYCVSLISTSTTEPPTRSNSSTTFTPSKREGRNLEVTSWWYSFATRSVKLTGCSITTRVRRTSISKFTWKSLFLFEQEWPSQLCKCKQPVKTLGLKEAFRQIGLEEYDWATYYSANALEAVDFP